MIQKFVQKQERQDEYAWLRDTNWREILRSPKALQPRIHDFLTGENLRCEQAFADRKQEIDALFAQMKQRIKPDEASVPRIDGEFAYFEKFVPGKNYKIHCRQKTDSQILHNSQKFYDPAVEILLDENLLARQHSYLRVIKTCHSPDHQFLAYSADFNGSEYYSIYIRDLNTGKDLDQIITRTDGYFVWGADFDSLFWVERNQESRPCRLWRRHCTTGKDQLIYEEIDPGFFLCVDKTETGRFIVVISHDHCSSEIRLLASDDENAQPFLLAPREMGVEYYATDYGEELLIRTNRDGAKDFKIVSVPIADCHWRNWRDMINHRPGRLIMSHHIYADHMVRCEMVNALPRILVTRLGGLDNHKIVPKEYEISFSEPAFDLSIIKNLSIGGDTGHILRYSYSSPCSPLQIYDYDLRTQKQILRKSQQIPGGHDPENYILERLTIQSHDHVEVPVTLLRHKKTHCDGSAPCLLYGYGAYGISTPASFSTNRLSLVDRGFVYAIAHIRGGMEKGYGWYEAGRREYKKNSFFDFIAVGEGLAAAKIVARDKIIAHGGSAGGMLVGAVANMRSDLFLGIIADVPFVDVLNTMLDADLPLTPPEWREWGNPINDSQAYGYIRSYSPYDNVCAQDYPSIFATAGLCDPRVTYWEPAKWIARLRDKNTGKGLLLLKTNMEAGHSGKSGRFSRLREVAMAYVFALQLVARRQAL